MNDNVSNLTSKQNFCFAIAKYQPLYFKIHLPFHIIAGMYYMYLKLPIQEYLHKMSAAKILKVLKKAPGKYALKSQ